MSVSGIDYIELYVGNLKQAVFFYKNILGFSQIGYLDSKHNSDERVSAMLVQGNIKLLLTSSPDRNSEVAQHVYNHGDGVKNIVFRMNDLDGFCYRTENSNPEVFVRVDEKFRAKGEEACMPALRTFGETIHSLISNDTKDVVFQNHDVEAANQVAASQCAGLTEIDHVAFCVNAGDLDKWAKYYIDIFDFEETQVVKVSTGLSGMNSKVLQSRNGTVKFPITEPAEGEARSQINTFLDYYNSPGVQHIAYLTDDILSTVKKLKQAGLSFLDIPDEYYAIQAKKMPELKDTLVDLKEHQVLVDKDEEGYLYQLFSKPIQTRPTFFVEIIQRCGAGGFGANNIKSLFEAIENDHGKHLEGEVG